jgi:beta-glucanase (GH16 family)
MFAQQRERDGCSEYNRIIPTGINCNQFEHGEWQLVFEDNFDGNHINTDIWFTCEDGWNRRHGTELQYYKDENIVINNGILHLEAREDPGMYPVWIFEGDEGHQENLFFNYSSGWIQTKSKYKYGLIEVRCKIPEGMGFWPAFWLYGNGYEVDVFEFAGDRPNRCNFNAIKWYCDSSINCEDHALSNPPFSNDYHVFSLEWDEFNLVYRIDGEEKFILSRLLDINGREVLDCINFHNYNIFYDLEIFPRKPMSIILNLAISDGGYCDPPNSETIFPSSLDIDYIRVYKRKSPNRVLTINQDYDTSQDCYLGGTIIMESNNSIVTVDNNQRLLLFAENEVDIRPETEFQYGSNVEISIRSNNRNEETLLFENNHFNDCIFYNQELDSTSEDKEDDIKIIPNPNEGHFSLIMKDPWQEYNRLLIFNQKGAIILEKRIGDSQEYDISLHAAPGIYYILIEGEKRLVKKKLIIQ